MGVLKDMTGQKFGRLTVLRRAGNRTGNRAYWVCKCDCGELHEAPGYNLREGLCQSCGCLQREWAQANRGEAHSRWKGGRHIDRNGYVTIRCYDFPGADGPIGIAEHIAVMAKHLGRPLFPDESVHHKNGIRHDNRMENLELRVSNHGQGQNVPDIVEWARDVLRRYSPSDLR